MFRLKAEGKNRPYKITSISRCAGGGFYLMSLSAIHKKK